MNSKKKLMNQETALKKIEEHYEKVEEWIPIKDIKNAKKWEVIEGMDVKKYIGKKINCEYVISDELMEECEYILQLKNKFEITSKTPKLDGNLILVLKFFNDSNFLYTYVMSSMISGIKNAIEYYVRGDKIATLRPFGESIVGLKVQLVDIFQCEHPRKYMNAIRDNYVKNDEVGNIYDIYVNIFKQYHTDMLDATDYYVYLFDNKEKKYLFYSEHEINDNNINDHLSDIHVDFDKKKHKYTLIKIFRCVYHTEMLIEMDRLLDDYNLLDEENYNESTFFVDLHFDMTKLAELKKRIFVIAQQEKFNRLFEDKTTYKKIHQYMYQVKIGEKVFVDISNGSKTLKDIINNFYDEDKPIAKYKPFVSMLKNATYEELTIEIVEKSLIVAKIDLKKYMDEYVKKHIFPKNLIEMKPTMVPKWKLIAQYKKK